MEWHPARGWYLSFRDGLPSFPGRSWDGLRFWQTRTDLTIKPTTRGLATCWRAPFLGSLLLSALMLGSRAPVSADTWTTRFQKELKNGGAFVQDSSGKVLFSYRADDPFIPASTMKVATAACALRHLGADYRFRTEFFLLDSETLGIKGYADPNLVSEEIRLIATSLRSKLSPGNRIRNIVVDGSYFAENLGLDGYAHSDNPYDALPAALAANFNTVFIERRKDGSVKSAESETPLTSIASGFGTKLKRGTKQRVNIGNKRGLPELYFGELFAEFFSLNSAAPMDIKLGRIGPEAKLLYRHLSSKPLEAVLRPMLKFSTNITANLIFLLLGAERFSAPANADKASRALGECLEKEFGIREFQIFDGAGLSHKNRVTPREFGKLLEGFAQHRNMLREDDGKFQAKTGSLKGVNTYAGYFSLPPYGEVRFGIFVNDKVPFPHKWRLAEMLYLGLGSEAPDVLTVGPRSSAPR